MAPSRTSGPLHSAGSFRVCLSCGRLQGWPAVRAFRSRSQPGPPPAQLGPRVTPASATFTVGRLRLRGARGPCLPLLNFPHPFRGGKSADTFSRRHRILSVVRLLSPPLESLQPVNLSLVQHQLPMGSRSHLPCSGPYTSINLAQASSLLVPSLSVVTQIPTPLSHILSGLDFPSRRGAATRLSGWDTADAAMWCGGLLVALGPVSCGRTSKRGGGRGLGQRLLVLRVLALRLSPLFTGTEQSAVQIQRASRPPANLLGPCGARVSPVIPCGARVSPASPAEPCLPTACSCLSACPSVRTPSGSPSVHRPPPQQPVLSREATIPGWVLPPGRRASPARRPRTGPGVQSGPEWEAVPGRSLRGRRRAA